MAINNVQGVNNTSQTTQVNQEKVKEINNSQTDNYIRKNDHMYAMHPQGALGGANINMQNIINSFRKNRRLEDRMLSGIDTGQSAYAIPPEMLDDVHKKMLGLHSGGHLKSMSQAFMRRLRRNQKYNIIDDNHDLQKNSDDDNIEVIKVKRKEGQTIDEGSINDVIKDMLKDKNNPTQRFMLISMTLQQPDIDKELKAVLEQILNKEFGVHGKEISAKINTVDEAAKFGNGNEKKITLFQDMYYELLKAQNFSQMANICFSCKDANEFSELTNLMNSAAAGDQKGRRLNPSDPNTIHDLISFMHLRSSFISMFESSSRFFKACKLPLKRKDKKSKLGSDLTLHPHPKNII